jgi:hypothetical protein
MIASITFDRSELTCGLAPSVSQPLSARAERGDDRPRCEEHEHRQQRVAEAVHERALRTIDQRRSAVRRGARSARRRRASRAHSSWPLSSVRRGYPRRRLPCPVVDGSTATGGMVAGVVGSDREPVGVLEDRG